MFNSTVAGGGFGLNGQRLMVLAMSAHAAGQSDCEREKRRKKRKDSIDRKRRDKNKGRRDGS